MVSGGGGGGGGWEAGCNTLQPDPDPPQAPHNPDAMITQLSPLNNQPDQGIYGHCLQHVKAWISGAISPVRCEGGGVESRQGEVGIDRLVAVGWGGGLY